jgi:hypothetical protein
MVKEPKPRKRGRDILPQRKFQIMLTKQELGTIIGSLHDTRCELEQHMGSPKTSLQNYSDMSTEHERANALWLKLMKFLADLKYGPR